VPAEVHVEVTEPGCCGAQIGPDVGALLFRAAVVAMAAGAVLGQVSVYGLADDDVAHGRLFLHLKVVIVVVVVLFFAVVPDADIGIIPRVFAVTITDHAAIGTLVHCFNLSASASR